METAIHQSKDMAMEIGTVGGDETGEVEIPQCHHHDARQLLNTHQDVILVLVRSINSGSFSQRESQDWGFRLWLI